MTRPGIEPRSPGPLVNIRTTMLMKVTLKPKLIGVDVHIFIYLFFIFMFYFIFLFIYFILFYFN